MNTVPDYTPDDMDPNEVFPMTDKLGIQFVEITPKVPKHAARIAEEDQQQLDDAMEFYKNVKKEETDG